MQYITIWTTKLADTMSFFINEGFKLTAEKHNDGPKHYSMQLTDDMLLEIYPSKKDTKNLFVVLNNVESARILKAPNGNTFII